MADHCYNEMLKEQNEKQEGTNRFHTSTRLGDNVWLKLNYKVVLVIN